MICPYLFLNLYWRCNSDILILHKSMF